MPRVTHWFRNLIFRHRIDRELDEEVRGAFDALADEYARGGMNEVEARRAAALALGGPESVKREIRGARAGALAEELWQDVTFGIRLLRRAPVLSAAATLSLAIGIGADTAVFALANALLLRPPAGVSEPERLVQLGRTDPAGGGPQAQFGDVSYPNFEDIRRRTRTLEDVYGAVLVPEPLSLLDGSRAERVAAGVVTPNYFAALGARPAVGRFFGAESAAPGGSPAVVLSHRTWVTRFAADPSIPGRTIRLNGTDVAVVGVAAERFAGTTVLVPDLWVPATAVPALKGGDFYLTFRDRGWLMLGGRLRPGVTLDQASVELAQIGRALEREYPDDNRGRGLRVAPLTRIPPGLVPMAVGLLTLVLALVSLVLVIACANLAGVLVARSAARRHELGVRMAIGAGRARLIRQGIVETALLFVAGGVSGAVLAAAISRLLVALTPVLPVAVDLEMPLDWRVLAFAAALSLVSAALCGLVPALAASRLDPLTMLRGDRGEPQSGARSRRVFVVAQVAFSVLLVTSAGLLIRGIWRATAIDLGFDPQNVEMASFDLDLGGYTDATAPVFIQELTERVRALPGVENATVAATMPMDDLVFRLDRLSIPGDGRGRDTAFDASWNVVEPGFFDVLRIPVVRGRDFLTADRAGTAAVAIVSEAAARQFWPGQDPVGKSLVLHGTGSSMMSRTDTDPNARRSLTVVGVVRDVTMGFADERVRPFVYLPLQQHPVPRLRVTLALRTQGTTVLPGVQSRLASLAPGLPVLTMQTLENHMAVRMTVQRMAARLVAVLGLVGLLLAVIGVYGITSHLVTKRTPEIGVRLALGAARSDVVRLVLRQGLALTGVGTGIGLLLAAGTSRLLATLLYGLSPLDPLTFGGVALLFATAGLAACSVPLRRAIRISPVEALRYE